MTKPLIQIDDEVREMTDKEYELYLAREANLPAGPIPPENVEDEP